MQQQAENIGSEAVAAQAVSGKTVLELFGFLVVIGFPFRILGATGFNAKALEQTVAGRIVKAMVGFVIFLAALLQVPSLLGLPTGW